MLTSSNPLGFGHVSILTVVTATVLTTATTRPTIPIKVCLVMTLILVVRLLAIMAVTLRLSLGLAFMFFSRLLACCLGGLDFGLCFQAVCDLAWLQA